MHGTTAAANLVTVQNNWLHMRQGAINSNSQGNIITYLSAGFYGTWIVNGNVNLMDCSNTSGKYGFTDLFYDNGNTSIVLQDHDTSYYPCTTVYGDYGYQYGEGTTAGSVKTSSANSSIAVGGAYGFEDGNSNGLNTFTGSPQYPSSCCGVHHNLTYGQTTTAYRNTGTKGTNWDDGTNLHPNAVYGDLTVNPNFFWPTVQPANFDAFLGGPGTIAHLMSMFALRWCGTGCSYDSRYTVHAMHDFLMLGMKPYNGQLNGAGYNGTNVGAIQPFPPAILSN